MLFNSLYFLLFYLAVLAIVYLGRPGWRAEKVLLLAASWLFYASWSPGFLAVLLGTTALDFQLARLIYRVRWDRHDADGSATRRAAWLVALSVALNLGLLAFFKYGRFLYQSVDAVVGLPPVPAVLGAVAPLGISFYTFHSISYVIDTWRGLRPPTDSFGDFALYVAFFPQLIAGPITRWGFFGPQLDAARRVELRQIELALCLLAAGFVKKVVLADTLGGWVDTVYAEPWRAGWVDAWTALYAYTFQIYFDFSGYTDIAMGLAGLLGFRLPENFRHPYLAETPSEFWRRWHISLSTWLRDYLYVALGGNRRGRLRTYANLLVTMLLGGLWHGAAWTFVLWGGFHGVWLAVHRALARDARMAPRTPLWFRRIVTFHLVAFGWVLFRAGSLDTATSVLWALRPHRPLADTFPLVPLALVAVGLATHALALRHDLVGLWLRLPRVAQGVGYGVAIVLIGLFSAQTSRFIYFQF